MTTAMTPSRKRFKALTLPFATARSACCAGIGALLLTACSSPPKPPSVDESTKRPVNARAAVELQACEGDLSRATILVSEMARAAAVSAAVTKTLRLQGVASDSAAMACAVNSAPAPAATRPTGNLVAVVPFGLGSAAWNVELVDAAALVRHANDAELILIRGRTDAVGDSLQETALARRRAEAAAGFLQQAGVSKDKLRLTWQGAGDHARGAAGLSGTERADRPQSRRVEIEFYTAAPVLVSLRNGPANGKGAVDASL